MLAFPDWLFCMCVFTGTIFSVTGNTKSTLHRVPSEYDVPPLPAPRGRNTPTLDTK